MQPLVKGSLQFEVNSFRLTSLFMRDFLRPEKLVKNRQLDRWLKVLDKVKAGNWGKWSEFTRRILLSAAAHSLSSTLERPISESERLFIAAYVEEFIEMYGVSRLQMMWVMKD